MRQSEAPARGVWTSELGFIIVAVGSATGLGNIWRFPYVVGENGGGAFIVVYLVTIVVLGVPLLTTELAIGRHTRADAIGAFERISRAIPWKWTGWLGVAASVAILAYYPVIVGWIARYLWLHTLPVLNHHAGPGVAPDFDAIIADPLHAVFWFWGVAIVAALIDAAGIERGIELANRVLMPVFTALLVALAGYSLFLPGAARAIGFLFVPDWSALLRPNTYIEAVGQAFFSLSLAMGVFVTYGAYLQGGNTLLRHALVISAADTLVSIVAGMMIFPVVFTYGVDPAHGSTLIFVVLPELFARMSVGGWIAIAFFLLLCITGLTSVVALLEVPVSVLIARLGWRRPAAAATMALAAFVLGIPAALGYGVLGWLSVGSMPPLEAIDHLTSDIILPLGGIALSLFAGWVWTARDRGGELGIGVGIGVGRLRTLWTWSLRLIIPATIALVMLRGLS